MEKDLKEYVIELLMDKIDGKPKTGYQLNKATGMNLSTCNQIINGTWNPTWSVLLRLKEEYDEGTEID